MASIAPGPTSAPSRSAMKPTRSRMNAAGRGEKRNRVHRDWRAGMILLT